MKKLLFLVILSIVGCNETPQKDVNKCLDTAKVVMSRRKIEFKKYDEELFRKIFDMTINDRMLKGLPG